MARRPPPPPSPLEPAARTGAPRAAAAAAEGPWALGEGDSRARAPAETMRWDE